MKQGSASARQAILETTVKTLVRLAIGVRTARSRVTAKMEQRATASVETVCVQKATLVKSARNVAVLMAILEKSAIKCASVIATTLNIAIRSQANAPASLVGTSQSANAAALTKSTERTALNHAIVTTLRAIPLRENAFASQALLVSIATRRALKVDSVRPANINAIVWGVPIVIKYLELAFAKMERTVSPAS